MSSKGKDKSELTFRHAVYLALAATAILTPFILVVAVRGRIRWLALAGPACVFSITLGLSLLVLVREERSLLWAAEKALRYDLDRDSVIGKPLQPREVRVEVVSDGGHRYRYASVPLSNAELKRLAQAVLFKGVAWSRRRLDEAGALSGEKYTQVLHAFESVGFVRMAGASPEAGYEVTPAGRAFLRKSL